MYGVRFLGLLGQRLRSERTVRGLSQEALARAAGLSTRYLSQLEAGRGNISILRLLELARALGAPLHELVRFDKGDPFVSVSLIGLRGAGKSTVGAHLAKALGCRFVELDALIEDTAGLSLGELFALHGEGYYRRVERDALKHVLTSEEPFVLATGGSLVTEPSTFSLLKESTVTVWLRAKPELHLSRVAAQGDRRPMAGRADPLSELRTLLRQREPLYREAELTLDTSEMPPEAVACAVIRKLRASGKRVDGVESGL